MGVKIDHIAGYDQAELLDPRIVYPLRYPFETRDDLKLEAVLFVI